MPCQARRINRGKKNVKELKSLYHRKWTAVKDDIAPSATPLASCAAPRGNSPHFPAHSPELPAQGHSVSRRSLFFRPAPECGQPFFGERGEEVPSCLAFLSNFR